jgi:MFS family permease
MFFKNMEPWFGMKGAWLTFWVTVACATDMTLFGYDQGVFGSFRSTHCHAFTDSEQGGVIVTPDFLDQLNLHNNPSLLSTVTAIYDIGCFFGAVSVCVIGEPLGRKKCVLLGTTIMSIGAIIQVASFGVPEMIVGRYAFMMSFVSRG